MKRGQALAKRFGEQAVKPNPSIERTSPGKPGAASHLKRWAASASEACGVQKGISMLSSVKKLLVLFGTLLLWNVSYAQVSPRIGDWWTFEVSDERQGRSTSSEVTRKVIALEADLMVLEVTTRRPEGDRKSRETRDMNLNILESGNLLYKPHLDLFRMPLVAGKRTYSIERVQIDSGRVVKMAGEIDVMPPQKIMTSAGEFEGQEVVANGRYLDPKTGDSSRYQTQAWFAPAVGFWVRQDHLERNTRDTADFSRTKVSLKAFQLQPR